MSATFGMDIKTCIIGQPKLNNNTMAKRGVMNKTKLTKKLDTAWSELVKGRAGYKCEVCGKETGLNSHHIVGRTNRTIRWDVRNGVCLCVSHHKFGKHSAHEDPLWFKEWLEDERWEDVMYLYNAKESITKWTLPDMKEKLDELLTQET